MSLSLKKTDTFNVEDDVPLQELKDKLTTSGKKKYVFKSKSFELIKRKCSRVFKCTRCDTTEKSQQHINNHFRQVHGLLSCETCDKTCNTVSALRKHMYEHSDIATKFKCKDCAKGFPFESQLKSHHKIHLTCLEHQCIRCHKGYKSKGELTKHLVTHTNKSWKFQSPGCDYKCIDPQNLCAHMHKHGDGTRYKCTNCNKGFNFYEQLKRHRTKTCTVQNS